jgi:hypothetical protein
MNQRMIDKLKNLAKCDCFYDDDGEPLVVDYVGSNVDDAFDLGERSGEVMLAREVLTALEIEWDKE